MQNYGVNGYLARLLRIYGPDGAYRILKLDMASDGHLLSQQGKAKTMAALIAFASRD